jgi:hypothetical protein
MRVGWLGWRQATAHLMVAAVAIVEDVTSLVTLSFVRLDLRPALLFSRFLDRVTGDEDNFYEWLKEQRSKNNG